MTLIDEIRIHPEEGAKRLESECKPGLQALARRLCSDEGDAEELVNRTLAEAISHIDSLISRPALFGWMCQILVDCHAKDNRRKSRSAEAPDNETVAAAVDEDAEARLFREVDAGILRDAIETLPDDIRKTVVMHYFMGVPVREAAKVLSVPTGTVAWRLHYARMLLAAKLGAAAKKPGGKALLVALVLAALTAVGATVATIVGDAAIGSRPQPAAEGSREPPAIGDRLQPAAESGRELSASGSRLQSAAESDLDPSASGSRLQSAAESDLDPSASGGRLQSATGCRLLSAPDTATSPMTGDTMNTTKTARALAAASLALTSGFAPADAPAETAALPAGITITISNFDEDLATVYVNGTAATNGETRVLADGESLTLELRDFRSDWYFAYAPDSQTDRTLALESWGGLPDGVDATANPVTFTPAGDLTVTPNVDCKGHVWHAVGTTAISNSVYTMAASGFNATKRILAASTFSAYYAGDKVMDFAMRVRKDGVNYTVTSLSKRGMFKNSGVTTVRVAPRLDTLCQCVTDGGSSAFKTFVGLKESSVTTVPYYAFHYVPLEGVMDNYIPHGATSIGDSSGGLCYNGRSKLTGPLILPYVTRIRGSAFNGCSGVTELCSTSSVLTTIEGKAFAGTTKMKKITLASPVLSSVASDAFNTAITNLTYLSAPPASHTPVDNIFEKVAASDGAKSLKVHLPLCTPGWWDWVSEPTAAEASAGLPDGCYGVYVTQTGARKGWIIATDDVDSSLVVTDMSQVGNAGYEIHADLAQGDTLTLSREGFTACDLQHFNRATGAWETFETKQGASFTYTHDGRLTRARWKISGFALTLSSDCHGGTFSVSGATPIAGDNIYAPGAVLTVTAAGRGEHPTSHFATWTSGVAGEATNSATITVIMGSDKVLTAAFYPDEWLYDASTKKITDGEYTSSAVTLDATTKAVAVPNFSGGQNYMLWLDLSLPVFVPSDPDAEYAITSFGIGGNSTFRKIRFGERFTAFTGDRPFSASLIIERLDNLGHTQMKVFPYCFTHNGPAEAPLHLTTKYEANDYIPETLVEVKDLWYTGGPYLVGTLRLPNFTTYGGNCNAYQAFSTRTAGVTNLYLTCEALSNIARSSGSVDSLFHGMELQELTIGSTNLVSAGSGAFSGAAATLERMNFRAHAPAAAALDNILASYNARTTTSAKPLEIRCSKYAPGWRELAAAVDRSSEEWRARPAGTWGIYQTAAGKRFYLVQRDSKYDKTPFTLIIMR